jgi:hypothetical protein
MSFHSRDELLAWVNGLSKKDYDDGIVLDIPKKRARYAAIGKKEFRPRLDPDQAKRFITQWNRGIELATKPLFVEIVTCRMERTTDARWKELADGNDAGEGL